MNCFRVSIFHFLIFLTAIPNVTFGQSEKDSATTTVPDIKLNHVLNWPTKSMSLSDFKGKLTILDFWGPNCISCLEAFPKIEKLQEKYKDKIQFILVNNQSEDSTKAFIKKMVALKVPVNVPMITEDTILSNMFPHRGMPFHVWIDSSVVEYQISGYYTSAESIDKYFSGKKPKIPKYKIVTYINSLFESKWQNNLEYYSYIAKGFDDVQIINSAIPENSYHLSLIGPILTMYQTAYGEMGKFPYHKPGRTWLITTDSSKFFPPAHDQESITRWRVNNMLTYDLLLPKNRERDRFNIMQQDLWRYYGLHVSKEKKFVKCYVLIKQKKSLDKLSTKGGETKNTFSKTYVRSTSIDSIRVLKNSPYYSSFSSALSYWIEEKFKMPFLDKTGYTNDKRIDLQISGKTLDSLKLHDLKNELKKYNLDIIEKLSQIDVLVVKDIQN